LSYASAVRRDILIVPVANGNRFFATSKKITRQNEPGG